MAKMLSYFLLLVASTFLCNVFGQSYKPIVAPGGYRYVGCYSDDTQARTIATQFTVQGSLTLENCAATCLYFEHEYMGVEFGDQCFCGDSIQSPGLLVSESSCSTVCDGDDTEICGADDIVSVYSTDPNANYYDGGSGSGSGSGSGTGTGTTPANKQFVQPGDYQYLGCYTDNVQDRTIAYAYAAPQGQSMTLEVCAGLCAGAGRSYFGVENAAECYCANSINPEASLANAGSCVDACQGDTTELCGGSLAINVYSTDPTQTYPGGSSSSSSSSSSSTSSSTSSKSSSSRSRSKSSSKSGSKSSSSSSKSSSSSSKSSSSSSAKRTSTSSASSSLSRTLVFSNSSTSASKSTTPPTATTKTTTAHPTVPVPAPGPTTGGTTTKCFEWTTIRKGDYCVMYERQYGVTFRALRELNPSINDLCSNLVIGYAYCVAGVPARLVGSGSGTVTETGTGSGTKSTSSHGKVATSSSSSTTHSVDAYFTSRGQLCARRTVFYNSMGVPVSTYPTGFATM